MSIFVPLIFFSLMFVMIAIILYVYAWRNRDFTLSEQISLLPLEKEEPYQAKTIQTPQSKIIL